MSQKTNGLLQLFKPNYNGTNWAATINNNFDTIDTFCTSIMGEVDNKIAALTPSVGDITIVSPEGAINEQFIIIGTASHNSPCVNGNLTKLNNYTDIANASYFAQVNVLDGEANKANNPIFIHYITNLSIQGTENSPVFSIQFDPNDIPSNRTIKVYCTLIVSFEGTEKSEQTPDNQGESTL